MRPILLLGKQLPTFVLDDHKENDRISNGGTNFVALHKLMRVHSETDNE